MVHRGVLIELGDRARKNNRMMSISIGYVLLLTIILPSAVVIVFVDSLSTAWPRSSSRRGILALNSASSKNDILTFNYGKTFSPNIPNAKDFDATTIHSSKASNNMDDDKFEKEEGDEDDAKEEVAEKPIIQPPRSLYEVLGCLPTDSRADIKRQFIKLAKETHPDATPGDDNSDRFSEIAHAWKTLSNERSRKRYDRSLRAEQIVDEFDKLADAAVPAVNEVMEKVAMPFLRRTTATTVASWTAFNNNRNLKDAIRAGKIAADSMTQMELVEKSDELREKANQEMATAMALKEEWSDLVSQRLEWSLQSENIFFTALEAAQLLDGWNVKDGATLFRRCTVADEINNLQIAEEELSHCEQSSNQLGIQDKELKRELEVAESNAKMALDAEEKARKALQEAILMVEKTQLELKETKNRMKESDFSSKRTTNDMDRLKQNLDKRRERVKISLQQKQKTILEKDSAARKRQQEQKERSLIEIASMRRQEKYLLVESTKMEEKAKRLFVQADAMLREAQDKKKK